MRLPLLALFAFALTSLAALSFGATEASAQDSEATCRQVRPGLIQCSPTTIEGSRPRAYFLLGRSRDHYELAPLRARDFAHRVRRSVRHRAFQ